MRTFNSYLFAGLIAFAPAADGARAEATIAEVVIYRLNDGVSQAEHIAAAQATKAFLSETGAVISRSLSVDDSGLWTDHIVWTSMEAARSVEAEAMQRPEFQAFFSGMDEASVTMRHAPIKMSQD